MSKQQSKSNADRDHEMKSLKNRISTLEEQLQTANTDFNRTVNELNAVNTENTRLKEQLADALNRVNAPDLPAHLVTSSVPMEIRASLIITAIAAIKDRQNDAPLDRKNFEFMVDPFIDQAAYIADKVIALCTNPPTEA